MCAQSKKPAIRLQLLSNSIRQTRSDKMIRICTSSCERMIWRHFLAAASISSLALISLICSPITYSVVRQVLNGAVGAELIEVLSKTAKLQLLMASLLAAALAI